MNIDEREKLGRFLQQLAEARVGVRDAEADRLIQEVCRHQPDANYLLVQRNLLMEQALGELQAEIARLKREQAEQGAPAGGFLDNNAWGKTSAQLTSAQRAPGHGVSQAAPVAAVSSPAWGSGLLGTLATTAAGAVAGAFLFQGIEHLMGNRGSQSGFLSDGGPLHSPPPAESHAMNQLADASSDADDDLSSLGSGEGDPDWV